MTVFEKYKRKNETAFLWQTEDRGIGYSRKLDNFWVTAMVSISFICGLTQCLVVFSAVVCLFCLVFLFFLSFFSLFALSQYWHQGTFSIPRCGLSPRCCRRLKQVLEKARIWFLAILFHKFDFGLPFDFANLILDSVRIVCCLTHKVDNTIQNWFARTPKFW